MRLWDCGRGVRLGRLGLAGMCGGSAWGLAVADGTDFAVM